MRTTKISIICWLAFCCAPATTGAPLATAVQTLERDLLASDGALDRPGLALVVTSADRVVFLHTQGSRRVDQALPIDSRTRFRLASLSKGFAGLLAALLIEEGRFAEGDRIQADIDYFRLMNPVQARQATWEHALSHRLGLPHYAYDRLLEANWKPDVIVRRYEKVRPLCAVGECYGYQNVAFNLFSEAVERRTGRRYEDQVVQRLFSPALMERANFGADGLADDDNYARPHVRKRLGIREVEIKTHYYLLPAAAGVNASIDDLAQWMMALLGHADGIPQSAIERAFTPRVQTTREMRFGWRARRLEEARYGLGFRIYDYAGHHVIYHAGSVEGYRAQFALIPESQVGIALVWNSESNQPWGAVPVFLDALFDLDRVDWMRVEAASGLTASP